MRRHELSPLDYAAHRGRLSEALERAEAMSLGVDSAVVTSAENVRWLTGFTGSSGIVVAPADPVRPLVLVTDGRYAQQAVDDAARCGATVDVVVRHNVAEMRTAVAELLGGGQRWGIEASDISLQGFESLLDAARNAGLVVERGDFVDVTATLADLRRTKSAGEIDRIRCAASIADAALAEVGHLLASGITEREFRNELDAAMRRCGADDVSFSTIVASGANAALPHHEPSNRVVSSGDAVVVDFGALVDGYHSDMTRTFIVDGDDRGDMSARHDAVRRACEAGVATVGPGTLARDIDAACRRELAAAGLEDELTHGIGHGVGLAIHEAPWVNSRSNDVLRPGDVVTVEPGAYRVGLGGVRVEELLVVTESGHLVLTSSPKESTCPQSPPTTSRTA